MLAPKGVPQAIVDRLYRETEIALQMPAIQEKLKTLGAEPMPMTREQFGKLVADEIAANKQLVAAAGIKPN
jgi:tripartite-type tricarboxylate transporter receptor subunit TctC